MPLEKGLNKLEFMEIVAEVDNNVLNDFRNETTRNNSFYLKDAVLSISVFCL